MNTKFYKNPCNIKGIGDPFVLKAVDGTYYCYATSHEKGFRVWSSKDIVNWKDEGLVYKADEKSWGYTDFWAPEVVEHESRYYMYYTARWVKNKSLRVGVAVSDSPFGPFTDAVEGQPMFDLGYAAIDANILIDEDSKKYLYFSRDCSENIIDGKHESHIYGVALKDDMISIDGNQILLMKPEQPWELKSGPTWFWNEGPFVIKRNGIYYAMYSANCYAGRNYSVGYAVSEKPLGPYKKYENNPILSSSSKEISGPGHNSVTISPDGSEWFIVYHTHTNPEEGGGNRQVCIDRMGFREDGSIYVDGPTLSEQSMPAGVYE